MQVQGPVPLTAGALVIGALILIVILNRGFRGVGVSGSAAVKL